MWMCCHHHDNTLYLDLSILVSTEFLIWWCTIKCNNYFLLLFRLKTKNGTNQKNEQIPMKTVFNRFFVTLWSFHVLLIFILVLLIFTSFFFLVFWIILCLLCEFFFSSAWIFFFSQLFHNYSSKSLLIYLLCLFFTKPHFCLFFNWNTKLLMFSYFNVCFLALAQFDWKHSMLINLDCFMHNNTKCFKNQLIGWSTQFKWFHHRLIHKNRIQMFVTTL